MKLIAGLVACLFLVQVRLCTYIYWLREKTHSSKYMCVHVQTCTRLDGWMKIGQTDALGQNFRPRRCPFFRYFLPSDLFCSFPHGFFSHFPNHFIVQLTPIAFSLVEQAATANHSPLSRKAMSYLTTNTMATSQNLRSGLLGGASSCTSSNVSTSKKCLIFPC